MKKITCPALHSYCPFHYATELYSELQYVVGMIKSKEFLNYKSLLKFHPVTVCFSSCNCLWQIYSAVVN